MIDTLFDFIISVISNSRNNSDEQHIKWKCSTIYKKDGSINHTGHSGNDRTPAQKAGDKLRRNK